MVADVFEGGSVSWPQRQTPLDELLAFWKDRRTCNKYRALDYMCMITLITKKIVDVDS